MSVNEETHRTTLFSYTSLRNLLTISIKWQSTTTKKGWVSRAASPQHQSHLSKSCSTRKLMRIGQFICKNNLKHYISKELLPIKSLHIHCFRKWELPWIHHSSHLWVYSPCQVGAADGPALYEVNKLKNQREIMGQ